MRQCACVCVCLSVCNGCWGELGPQSPWDGVSHKLHHKAALLSLAWVRPLLSSSNMPATCSHTRTEYTHLSTHSHTRSSAYTDRYAWLVHLLFSGKCNKNTKSGHATFFSQDPRAARLISNSLSSHRPLSFYLPPTHPTSVFKCYYLFNTLVSKWKCICMHMPAFANGNILKNTKLTENPRYAAKPLCHRLYKLALQ